MPTRSPRWPPAKALASAAHGPGSLGLFHTGCGGGADGKGDFEIFSLTTSIMAVGLGNYGLLGAGQQQRYTDANAETMFSEPATGGTPDEQPGAMPEIFPSAPNGDPAAGIPANIDRCWTCRSQVMQAWGNYGTVWPVVHQQLGVRPFLPDGELDVVPQVPPGQPSVAGSDIRLGAGSADVLAARAGRRYTTTVALHHLSLRRLVLGVTLPLGSRRADGHARRPARPRTGLCRSTNRGIELTVDVRAGRPRRRSPHAGGHGRLAPWRPGVIRRPGNFRRPRLLSAVMRPMRALLTVVWAAAVLAALLLAGPAGARAAELPRAQLSGYSCRLAIDPGARAIAATAVMRPVTGTRHMAIRFDLLSRAPGGAVTEVHGGDLGQFTAPANPTLGQLPADVWRVHKLVVPLAAPAVYHLRAEFRWTGAGGVCSPR